MTLTAVSAANERARRDIGFGDVAQNLKANWGASVTESLQAIAINRAVIDILRVGTRMDNWDGFDSPAPSPEAVSAAMAAVVNFSEQVLASGLIWDAPYVGSNENGEISFEWWMDARKLTIYVGPEHNHFVSSWGPHIEDHMDAGVLGDGEFVNQWRWFRQRHQ